MSNSSTKFSIFSSCLIWFGAAVSIAEILTGTLFAPLGFAKGLAAIIIGHIIGVILFFLAGYVGARSGKCAMDTVKMSFGSAGAGVFSALNILQLVGWTAIMIIAGAKAAETLIASSNNLFPVLCCAIGLLVIIWIISSARNLTKLNTAAMSALFILSCIMSVAVFRCKVATPAQIPDQISFTTAVELAIAMPLSWLPLVADYTMNSKRPLAVSLAGSVVYFLTSSWMYMIGLAAALFAGSSDIAVILKSVGLPMLGILIIVFSTVTTTYLDAYSAGVSAKSIFKGINSKVAAVAVCVVGSLLAIFTSVAEYENFLLTISSVFVPMGSVIITDHFITGRNSEDRRFNLINAIVWFVGFIFYRFMLAYETTIGSTVPVVILTLFLTVITSHIRNPKNNSK